MKISPVLRSATNAVRKMLMHRGYFVRDIFAVDKDKVDMVAIREGLMNSERWRIRLILPHEYGGLGTIQTREFFREQARVHNLKGMIISLGPVSYQAAKVIEKHGFNVCGLEWLESNTDFDLKSSEKIQDFFGLSS